jgi:hypothetical protein
MVSVRLMSGPQVRWIERHYNALLVCILIADVHAFVDFVGGCLGLTVCSCDPLTEYELGTSYSNDRDRDILGTSGCQTMV